MRKALYNRRIKSLIIGTLGLAILLANNVSAQVNEEIAREQFEMPFFEAVASSVDTSHSIIVKKTDSQTSIFNKGFRVVFDNNTGYLSGYSVKDLQLIAGSLKPNFWRPDLDNDVRGWMMG